MNAVCDDDWRLIGHDTLSLYRTHGTGRLTALKQHIIDNHRSTGVCHGKSLLKGGGHRGSPYRVEHVRRPVSTTCLDATARHGRRRLPLRVDGDMGAPLGQLAVIPVRSTKWVCDCPWG